MAYLEQLLRTLTDDQLKLEMKVMSTVQHVCGLGRGSRYILQDSNWVKMMEILPWCLNVLTYYL